MKRNRLLFFCALLFGMILFTGCSNESALEESAAPLVTSIIADLGFGAKCTDVEITETINENTYKAKASLDNGNTLTISIVDLGDQIKVDIIE